MEHDPFDMLFRAKWNIPQAAAALGHPANEQSWQQIMTEFKEYCKRRPVVYTKFSNFIQLSFF